MAFPCVLHFRSVIRPFSVLKSEYSYSRSTHSGPLFQSRLARCRIPHQLSPPCCPLALLSGIRPSSFIICSSLKTQGRLLRTPSPQANSLPGGHTLLRWCVRSSLQRLHRRRPCVPRYGPSAENSANIPIIHRVGSRHATCAGRHRCLAWLEVSTSRLTPFYDTAELMRARPQTVQSLGASGRGGIRGVLLGVRAVHLGGLQVVDAGVSAAYIV